jgi:hypothetical protein
MPKTNRHNKLINPGKIGVFIGYEKETTKYFRVYSPEYGYMIRRNIIRVDKDIKGRTVDLRIRGIPSNQGTLNIIANQKPKGRPKKNTEAIITKPEKIQLQILVLLASNTVEKLDLLSRSSEKKTSGILE